MVFRGTFTIQILELRYSARTARLFYFILFLALRNVSKFVQTTSLEESGHSNTSNLVIKPKLESRTKTFQHFVPYFRYYLCCLYFLLSLKAKEHRTLFKRFQTGERNTLKDMNAFLPGIRCKVSILSMCHSRLRFNYPGLRYSNVLALRAKWSKQILGCFSYKEKQNTQVKEKYHREVADEN